MLLLHLLPSLFAPRTARLSGRREYCGSARMAELVDAADSKSADRKVMGVRFSLWACWRGGDSGHGAESPGFREQAALRTLP